eukprot:11453932-Heterocapsa_arctica.AAC.1
MEAYGFQENLTSMQAYSDHSSRNKAPELYQHLANDITVYHIDVIKGLLLGNQNDTNRECRQRRKVESCRIGEAANPGPGLENKQQKQFKLGDLFCRNHIQMDSKSEWCKALGNQVRESIIEKANIYRSVIFEFDTDGEEFINVISETSDRKQWGGAIQITIFAKLENIKIE